MSFWPIGAKSAPASRGADRRAYTFAVDSVETCLDRIEPADPRAVWKSRGISQLESLDKDPLVFVQSEPVHGLLAAVHRAYAEHRPLALAPEHLWLCVLQAIARVVEEEPERYRRLFVAHEGKELVTIQRDEFIPGSADNDWAGAVRELGDGVRARSSERAKSFLAPSGACETGQIACEISLLGAMQSYFEFEVCTMCGIPSITLEGSPHEWSELRERTALLDELGLREWRESLDAVFDRFVKAASGEVSTKFWREIYKREDASGGPRISGWINTFIPFLGDRGTASRNALAFFGKHRAKHAFDGVGISALPPGLSTAPFNWVLLGEPRPMSFVAGFTGVAQDPNGTVRPRLGWAVTDRVERKRFRIRREGTIAGVPTLSPRSGEKHIDLRAMVDEAKGLDRWAADFAFCQSLVSLDGIQPSPGLVSLNTLSTAIPTIEPLHEHPTIEQLRLHQDDALVDVRALRSLPSLKKLGINHCNNLRDWSPLLALEQLDELMLHGKTVPKECIGIHRGPEAVHAALSKLRACITH